MLSPFEYVHFVCSSNKIRLLHDCIVLVCVELSSRSIFNVSENQAKNKGDFDRIFEFFQGNPISR